MMDRQNQGAPDQPTVTAAARATIINRSVQTANNETRKV